MYQQQQKTTAKYIAIGASTVLLIGGGIIGLVGLASNMASPQRPADSSQETVESPDAGSTDTPYSGYPSTPSEPDNSTTTPSEPSTPTTPSTPDKKQSSDNQDNVQKKVILNYSSLNLYVGNSAQLAVTVEPYSTSDRIVWSSNNLKVATVENGKVTAKKAGTVEITVTVNDLYTEKCTVKVQEKPAQKPSNPSKPSVVNPTGISVNKSRVDLIVGHSIQVNATVSPNNANNKSVTWSSQNTRVATVHNGKITAVGTGSTLVLAKTYNGKTASVRVYVRSNAIAVDKIRLNVTNFTIRKKESYTLSATITPSNASNKTITWTSSNTSIATVSGGKVTGKKAGTVTITAKTHNGKTATAKITVIVPASGDKLNKTSANVIFDGSVTISATVSPSDASNKSVTWTSSNTSIATVSGGKVTSKKVGTVTITAKIHNGKTATAKVTVHNKPSLSVGATTIMDEHTTTASAKNVSGTIAWSSSNTSIFTVNSSGTIKGKKPGSATLTMKAKNKAGGSVSLTQKITVREMKVLFVGNSKTDVNDIDKKFETISENRGYSVAITRVVKGGKTLEWIYNNQGTNIKKAYDYAILQEQTDTSLIETSFYNGAIKIAKALKSKNNAVKIYVRKTWHKKTSSSSQKKIANQVATNVASRIKKDAGVWSANTNDGDAIYAMQSKGYTVISDSVHQNALGSYVAASCISSKVFGFDPTKITTKAGIGSSDSVVKTARSVVKDKCYNK